MKKLLAVAVLWVTMVACATMMPTDAERLALYRANAGEPVSDFQFFGRLDGWTPLGDRTLAVWTQADGAYLLELTAACADLDFAPAISITSQMSQVSAGFDQVIVRDSGNRLVRSPCRIREIRALDVRALKQAQNELRQANAIDRTSGDR